jgi:integrase
MARRPKLTDRMIAQLPRRGARYLHADPEQPNLFLRVPPTGAASFTVIVKRRKHRASETDKRLEQVWHVVGDAGSMGIEEARGKAREAIRRVKAGLPPVEPPKPAPQTVAAVAHDWLTRVVDAERHRTAPERRRVVERYIVPHIGSLDFIALRRSDIARLLDTIQDEHGPQQADAVLSVLRAIASWVQSREDDYRPPFVRGMKRTPRSQHLRSRILTDDELRAVWLAANTGVRLLLLSAQRTAKIVDMRWQDIDEHGVWHMPQAAREKSNAGRLQLPQAALDIIAAQPRLAGSLRVFAVNPLSGQSKARLDRASGVSDWRLHDLRRTARSLMSRAGVQSEIAERVLGHVAGGVRGIYDRHSYDTEKGHALAQLAALIERIVNPPTDNVVAMHEAVS